jgi:O-antigen ligase
MSGLDAFQAMITLVGIVLFIQQWKTRRPSVLQIHSLEGIGFGFLCFFVIVLLGWFFNSSHGVSYFEGLRKLKWIYNWYLGTSLFFLFPFQSKNLKWVAGALGFLGVYGLAVFFAGYDLIRGPSWYMHPTSEAVGASVRYGGLFGHPMTFSHVMLPLVMWISGLCLVFLWQYKGKFLQMKGASRVVQPKESSSCDTHSWWLLLSVSGGALSILLTFTRGVWLASAVGVLVMLFMLNKKWMLSSLLMGLFLLFGLAKISPQFEDRLLSAVNIQHKHHDERKLVWRANFEMFKDYPWLGIGFKDNTRRLDEYYDRLQIPQTTIKSHAHNQFLQVLATTGILGLLVYMLIWGRLIQLAFRNWKDLIKLNGQLSAETSEKNSLLWMQGLSLGAIGAFAAFLVAGISECNFDDAKVNYMLAFVVASVMWVRSQIRSSAKEVV